MSAEQKSVLIVDDDPVFLDYARKTIDDAGFPSRCAKSAAEAGALLKKEDFSVVLADMVLPESCGLDVLAEARRKDPLAVGILMTSFASTESAVEALREGAYDYVIKPCEPDILVAAVRRAAEHHALNAALLQKTAQLEKMQLQLNHKSQLLHTVSHELKNPLSVVYGYAAFLLKLGDEAEPADMQRSVRSIYNNAERLGHLLEELLESARLANHKITLRPEALPLAKLCEETIDNFHLEAERRGIDLALKCSCPEAILRADGPRAHQVLSNLMSNALKFTRTGGSVTLSADLAGDDARFSVADTGCGISREDMPHLFDRFYQSETTRRDHAGLGLGLEIAKALVVLHGGRIWVESEPGRGTTFRFTLPLQAAAAPQKA